MSWLHYIVFLIFIGCAACSGEDDIPDASLTGKIEGKDFVFQSARYSETEDKRLMVEIFREGENGPGLCGVQPGGPRITFTALNTMDRQQLFLDLMNFEAFTVTLFDPETGKNIVASEGYFELIENRNNTITAYLKAFSGTGNFVEGRFTAGLCD